MSTLADPGATPVPREIDAILGSGRPLLLDGGLGSELAARGCDISSPLWSAELILSRPQELLRVHRAYLDAGADCITTSSYQASVPGLRAQGLRHDQIRQVFERSVELARRAGEQFLADNPGRRRPLIAASIGPYGAFLADGSEYRGNYGLSDDELVEFHAERLAWLDQSGADLIACETIPDLQEAGVLARLLETVETPAWVSLCCRDAESLRDGNPVSAALDAFRDHRRAIALGANCCAPEIIEPLIKTIRRRLPDKLIVVYPNSGEQYDAATRDWRGDRSLQHWSQLAGRWYAAGADIIGGCCRIGPDYIRELASKSTWRC